MPRSGQDDELHGYQHPMTERRVPTAVAAFNDRCAVGMFDECSRSGVDVSGQLSDGYDDDQLAGWRT